MSPDRQGPDFARLLAWLGVLAWVLGFQHSSGAGTRTRKMLCPLTSQVLIMHSFRPVLGCWSGPVVSKIPPGHARGRAKCLAPETRARSTDYTLLLAWLGVLSCAQGCRIPQGHARGRAKCLVDLASQVQIRRSFWPGLVAGLRPWAPELLRGATEDAQKALPAGQPGPD